MGKPAVTEHMACEVCGVVCESVSNWNGRMCRECETEVEACEVCGRLLARGEWTVNDDDMTVCRGMCREGEKEC